MKGSQRWLDARETYLDPPGDDADSRLIASIEAIRIMQEEEVRDAREPEAS